MEALKTIGGVAVLLVGGIGMLLIQGYIFGDPIDFSAATLPWLLVAYHYTFAAAILMLLPLSALPWTRAFAAIGFMIASYVFGATTWVVGLLVTYTLWGGYAVFIGLFMFGVGVVPLGIVAAALKGEWTVVFNLVCGLLLTFGTRLLSIWLHDKAEQRAAARRLTAQP